MSFRSVANFKSLHTTTWQIYHSFRKFIRLSLFSLCSSLIKLCSLQLYKATNFEVTAREPNEELYNFSVIFTVRLKQKKSRTKFYIAFCKVINLFVMIFLELFATWKLLADVNIASHSASVFIVIILDLLKDFLNNSSANPCVSWILLNAFFFTNWNLLYNLHKYGIIYRERSRER